MKVKIKRGTVAGGKARVIGDVVVVPDSEARYLIAIGKAEKYTPKPVKQAVKKAKKAIK